MKTSLRLRQGLTLRSMFQSFSGRMKPSEFTTGVVFTVRALFSTSGLVTRRAVLAGLALFIFSCSVYASPLHEHQAQTESRAGEELNVVLLVNNEENPFWRQAKIAALKAATDLGIQLKVISINNNPLRPIRAISTLIQSKKKPDAVIFPNIKNTGKPLLELLEKHHIYSVIYDNGFSPKDKIPPPGQRYHFWLGHLAPTNYEASRALTEQMIRAALKQFPEQRPLKMIILEGNNNSQTSSQRLLGMFDALSGFQQEVEVRQIFKTRYNPQHAYNAVVAASQRYPGTRIIWAANDAMALKAVEASIDTGTLPGRDILISGFDLLPITRQQIQRGQIYNSYGGHAVSAAWALVYLFDNLNRKHPQHREIKVPMISGRERFTLPFPSPDGIIRITPEDDFSNIDFSRYSQQLNPGLQSDQTGPVNKPTSPINKQSGYIFEATDQ